MHVILIGIYDDIRLPNYNFFSFVSGGLLNKLKSIILYMTVLRTNYQCWITRNGELHGKSRRCTQNLPLNKHNDTKLLTSH